MRLRTPTSAEAVMISEQEIPASTNKTHTFKVTVITPIYGGGVQAGKPDKDMPIRATAIRGQLRYWWRFLQSHGGNPLSGEALFNKEREIWGGMGEETERKEKENGNKEDFSSKVFIRCKILKNKPTYSYDEHAPQYALFPARAENNNPTKELIRAGIEFELIISHAQSVSFKNDLKPALRWWSSFGGIGARTRRGAGSVQTKDLDPVTEQEAQKLGCMLKQNHASNAMKAWENAVERLHQFRQGADIGRNGRFGRSLWPEPDSIREITNLSTRQHSPEQPARLAFPRAAFGLPIIFKFKDDQGHSPDPFQTELRPINSERMTSPLILKAMATKNGYKSIALLLPINNQKNLKLELHGVPNKPNRLSSNKKKEWSDKNWDSWPENWWSTSKATDVAPIQNHNTSDPLTAFMNYFKPDDGGAY